MNVYYIYTDILPRTKNNMAKFSHSKLVMLTDSVFRDTVFIDLLVERPGFSNWVAK